MVQTGGVADVPSSLLATVIAVDAPDLPVSGRLVSGPVIVLALVVGAFVLTRITGVVARIGDEVTVKRWRRQGTQVQLLPENPEFEPILLDSRHDSFALEGLGVGLLRTGRGL